MRWFVARLFYTLYRIPEQTFLAYFDILGYPTLGANYRHSLKFSTYLETGLELVSKKKKMKKK
jgi:hypothetical protein